MTENPLSESIINSSEKPDKKGELTVQEKLEWSITTRLVQLALKRDDLKGPIVDLLKLVNGKVAKKLEENKYKEAKDTRFNLEKFEKSTAERLSRFAVYANSGRFAGTNALDLVQQITLGLDTEKANAMTELQGFVGDYGFPDLDSEI